MPGDFVVFGATGRVGGAAAAELLRRRLPVRAVSRDLMRGRMLAPAGCEVVTADLRNEADVRSAIDGAAGVLIVCPLGLATKNPITEARSIIDAVARAVDSARPPAVVVISQYGAHHRSGTGLPVILHWLESRLRTIPAPMTFLRSAEHMQNWARYWLLASRTGVLPSMFRPLTRPFPVVSADDVGIEAATLLAQRDVSRAAESPRIVHVEGPCRYSALDVAATFTALLSRAVIAEEFPRDAWLAQLVAAGHGETHARLAAELADARNAGRIEAETGVGEIRRGHTTLSEALAAALAAGAGTGRSFFENPRTVGVSRGAH
jgi:NAD(P)H dehydrogenase (quinone)